MRTKYMNDAIEIIYNLGGQACRSKRPKQLNIVSRGNKILGAGHGIKLKHKGSIGWI